MRQKKNKIDRKTVLKSHFEDIYNRDILLMKQEFKKKSQKFKQEVDQKYLVEFEKLKLEKTNSQMTREKLVLSKHHDKLNNIRKTVDNLKKKTYYNTIS